MPRPVDPRIQALEEKAGQFRAKAAQLRAKDRQVERKEEDSKAFLIGRFVQHQLKGGHLVPELRTQADLLRAMDPYLVRDYDRAKFGLPLLEQSSTPGDGTASGSVS